MVELQLEIPYDSLPPGPKPEDIHKMSQMIPESDHENVVLSVLSICLLPQTSTPASSSPSAPLYYTASERAFLSRTLQLLDIPYKDLLSAEDHVAQGLYRELKSREVDQKKTDTARISQEEGWGGYWGRMAATAAGVIVGSVAIGLTSGLAAPALLPLLPFLSAGSAPVVLGTLFGLTGGGLAGRRVNKRWAGVDVFEFVQITGGGEESDPNALTHKAKEELPGAGVEKAQAPSLVVSLAIQTLLRVSYTDDLAGDDYHPWNSVEIGN